MAKQTRSPEALTLLYLRNERGWTQKELTDALGLADDKQLSATRRKPGNGAARSWISSWPRSGIRRKPWTS